MPAFIAEGSTSKKQRYSYCYCLKKALRVCLDLTIPEQKNKKYMMGYYFFKT